MSRPVASPWGKEDNTVVQVAQNVSTRYLAYLVDAVLGLVMLPFNLSHLGLPAYGLWMVMTSIAAFFAILDLGYGGSLVRFVARYRARRDAQSLNEVLSTSSVVFAGIGAIAFLVTLLVAFNLHLIPKIAAGQRETARILLLIIGANVAVRFGFGVYGGVIVGFQRYNLNNMTSIATSVLVAAVNVVVLLAGYGVVELVAATTAVRLVSLLVYRLNAYRVYPGLQIRWSLYRSERLREVTSFSVFMLLLDVAYSLNYSTDVLIIGALMGTPAVALWVPAQRLAEILLKLSNQLSDALFPMVVDADAAQRDERLQRVLLEGTRLSLAAVIPIAGGAALLARPLIGAWIGPNFAQTALVAQLLAVVVILRAGASTASVVLKGAGLHKRLTLLIGGAALVNLPLSVFLISRLGLAGVAIGTLVPVATVILLGIVPTACRRVGLPLGELVRQAVWPTAWPGIVAGLVVVGTRSVLPASLLAVAAQLALGCLIYFPLFLVAVGTEGRAEYLRLVNLLRKHLPAGLGRFGTANAS